MELYNILLAAIFMGLCLTLGISLLTNVQEDYSSFETDDFNVSQQVAETDYFIQNYSAQQSAVQITLQKNTGGDAISLFTGYVEAGFGAGNLLFNLSDLVTSQVQLVIMVLLGWTGLSAMVLGYVTAAIMIFFIIGLVFMLLKVK